MMARSCDWADLHGWIKSRCVEWLSMSLVTLHEGIVNSDASPYVVVTGNGGRREPLGSMRASLLVWHPSLAEGVHACWKEGGTWVSGEIIGMGRPYVIGVGRVHVIDMGRMGSIGMGRTG